MPVDKSYLCGRLLYVLKILKFYFYSVVEGHRV